jgi:purine-binding chemotaxis protein CheW
MNLISEPTEEESLYQNKLIVFKSNEVLFALPLKTVIEIQDDFELLELPWKENGVIGAVEYRGILVPVFNICMALNLHTSKSKTSKSCIVIEFNTWKIAFEIDEFYKIIENHLKNEEEFLENTSNSNQFISGITILDKQSLIILNINEIINYLKNKIKKQINFRSLQPTQEKIDLERNIETIKSLCFSIENIQFIVPIQDVLEVLENQSVTPLFKVNPSLRGIINLRGRVVACFDISSFLGLKPRNLNESTQFVLLGYEDYEIAICVDSINKMKTFSNSDLQTNTDSLPTSIKEYTTGILQIQKQTLLMISTKNIILSKELQPYWNLENL